MNNLSTLSGMMIALVAFLAGFLMCAAAKQPKTAWVEFETRYFDGESRGKGKMFVEDRRHAETLIRASLQMTDEMIDDPAVRGYKLAGWKFIENP